MIKQSKHTLFKYFKMFSKVLLNVELEYTRCFCEFFIFNNMTRHFAHSIGHPKKVKKNRAPMQTYTRKPAKST